VFNLPEYIRFYYHGALVLGDNRNCHILLCAVFQQKRPYISREREDTALLTR